MKQLYLLLARNQKIIKKLFVLTYLILIAIYFVGIWQYDNLNPIRGLYNNIGRKSGQISTVLLLITLLPGMLKRINILGKIESILMLFRRQFGVLSFFMATTHLGYMSWIRKVASGENPIDSIFKYQEAGFVAMAIFFVLWITSNDFSMDVLGKWWKYLQRTSYFAVIALILHIFAAGSKLWMILLFFLVAEAFSWSILLIRNKNTAVPKKKTKRSKKK